MKKSLFCSVICLLVLTSCNLNIDSFSPFQKQIVGSGTIKNKTYQGDFNRIKIAQSLDAEILKSDSPKVIITAPEDLLPYILVEYLSDELYIHLQKNVNISTDRVAIKIFAKGFSALTASSSSSLKVIDKFTQDRVDIESSSSADISGDLEANDLSIAVSSSGSFSGKIWAVDLLSEVTSSGDIIISGKTKNANLTASSSGTLNASKVVAENADLKASSSGDVSIGVINQLNAQASSSGDIVVYKKGPLPLITKNESSSGSVTIK